MYHSKHFSLAEARELLPGIKKKLSLIIALKKSLDSKGIDIRKHHYFGGIGSNGSAKYDEDLDNLINEVKEITAAGIIIKSLDSGLIDFPHIRNNGEEVYLCFESGENDIEYWHAIPDGFAGRKPIEEL